MGYLDKIKKSLSFSNFKKGFDEEKIYGPLCLLGILFIVLLLLFDIINLKIFLFLFLITAYIFFIYFPFHRKPVTVFAFLLFCGFLVIIGTYYLFKGINFSDVKVLSILWWVYLSITLLFEYLASFKHDLEDIDIFFGYVKKKVGMWLVIILFPLAYYAFVFVIGTYALFGKEHIYIWIPIFFFWTISIIRLFIYKVLR